MKKAAAILLSVAVIMTAFLSFSGARAATVYFAVINENVMDLTVGNMPIKYNKIMYVPYTLFAEPSLGVYYSYNPDDYSITFFNRDNILTFNLNTGIAYDQNQQYRQRAVLFYGMVYVPAEFMCSRFGWIYSYLETGPSVRIRTSASKVSDALFERIAKDYMAGMLSQYEQSMASASPQASSATVSPTPAVHIRKEAYLTFNGGPDEGTGKALDILDRYRVSAAFFLDGDLLRENSGLLRRICGSGHTIGLLFTSPSKNASDGLETLGSHNDMLDRILFARTRLIRFAGGSGALDANDPVFDQVIALGYRYWDWNVYPDSSPSYSSFQIAARAIRSLSRINGAAVIRLNTGEASVGALPAILDYLTDENYIIRSISENTMPINDRKDIR